MATSAFTITQTIFISEITVRTKTNHFLILETKCCKIKMYGPKWEQGQNVETKMVFMPFFFKLFLSLFTHNQHYSLSSFTFGKRKKKKKIEPTCGQTHFISVYLWFGLHHFIYQRLLSSVLHNPPCQFTVLNIKINKKMNK